ncbi:hypothetical protein BJX96DRAFT_163083 [Aspergillus floccosus]
MAEAIGVVSAGIGIAAFAFQVAGKIERLKGLRQFNTGKAKEELEFLIQRLEVLRASLLLFDAVQRSSAVDLAVSNCQLAYSSVDVILQRVSGRLTQELRQARERVDSVISDLTLSCSGRLWAMEYTPLSMFSMACNNPHSLAIERVVKYTSPGFETLWSFRRGLLSLSETQERFRELKKSEPSLKQHVHPGGRNYVQESVLTLQQELLHYGPNGVKGQIWQFELLEFFVRELGMTLENEDQRFLVSCAMWIGEGRHLDLLATILKYGFDPGCIESPVYEDWPARCSPNWSSEQFTPDPFFIEYLAMLVEASPGFAGSTPLHDAVLLESPASLASLLSRADLHVEKNFLGQTPLHLGVRNVEIIRLLVNAGHHMDITDSQGITPLMYAAAMGKTDVVQLLITRGANPCMQDLKWKRDFIAYAAARGNWELIMDALGTIHARCRPKAFQYFVSRALMLLLPHDMWLEEARRIYFARLVALLADTNIKFHDSHHGTGDNNLLHYVLNEQEASTLVQYGFQLICLREGLHIFSSDGCRCPCSPEGCSLSAAFHTTFRDSILIGAPSFVWALEFLSLVEEIRGPEDAQKLLLAFLRRMKSDQIGLTHVCCHRGQGIMRETFLQPAAIPDDDVDEILDEEEEFISELEDDMLSLASDPLESLKSQWMIMLRDRYCEELEASEKRNKKIDKPQKIKRKRYEVDYKNDRYHICFDSDFNIRPCVSGPMAEYIVWLEHQYSRLIDSGDSRCHRDAWYNKRLTWVFEFMQIMQIDAETMVDEVNNTIKFGSWEEPGNPDKDSIVEHFLASVKRLAASS